MFRVIILSHLFAAGLMLGCSDRPPDNQLVKPAKTKNGDTDPGNSKPGIGAPPRVSPSALKVGMWLDWVATSTGKCKRGEIKELNPSYDVFELYNLTDCTTADRKLYYRIYFQRESGRILEFYRVLDGEKKVVENAPASMDPWLNLAVSSARWWKSSLARANESPLAIFMINGKVSYYLDQMDSPFNAFAARWEARDSAGNNLIFVLKGTHYPTN